MASNTVSKTFGLLSNPKKMKTYYVTGFYPVGTATDMNPYFKAESIDNLRRNLIALNLFAKGVFEINVTVMGKNGSQRWLGFIKKKGDRYVWENYTAIFELKRDGTLGQKIGTTGRR